MMREIEKASHRGQGRICKLLQRLGVTQEGSESSSVGAPVAAAGLPHAGDAGHGGDFSFRSGCGWRDQEASGKARNLG